MTQLGSATAAYSDTSYGGGGGGVWIGDGHVCTVQSIMDRMDRMDGMDGMGASQSLSRLPGTF